MLLTREVQCDYQRRYDDEGDVAPIEAAEFLAPQGLFVVIYDDDVPVAMGGWRRHGDDGELKRMYVRESARGRGLARTLLAHLERTAAASGITRLLLETGLVQPEAINLYRSSGYTDTEPFGYYVGEPLSVHLAKVLDAGSES
ncbi:MAG: GNAT family N-acetyltransferase [Actinomycetota bacterium]|nr:GNAT family N-acetyltransferase [Actinomycetota bacterium]